MKIISKFRDYYDGMARYGIDDSLMFIRKSEVTQELIHRDILKDFPVMYTNAVIFSIAGIFVPAIATDYEGWDLEDHKPIKLAFSKEELDVLAKDSSRYRIDYFRGRDKEAVFRMKELPIPKKAHIEMFWDFKATNTGITFKRRTNPRLLDFGVESVVSPYDIHQNLMQLLANESNPERPMLPIDDRVRIQQHGFDTKISFRKRAGN